MDFTWIDKLFQETAPIIFKKGEIETKKQFKALDLFKTGRKKYFFSLKNQIGSIQILGMEQPIKLDQLFVKVGFSETIQSRSYGNLKSLLRMSNEEYRKKRGNKKRDLAEKSEVKFGADIIETNPHLVVLGKPGSGKTTFLKFLALHYGGLLEEQPPDSLFPFFISLREFADTGKKPVEFIIEKMKETGFFESDAFFDRIANKGLCLFLFDGLDEISEDDTNFVIAKLKVFYNQYSNNKIVITCRTSDYHLALNGFTETEVCDFSYEEIKIFIKKWFINRSPKRGNQLLSTIAKSPQIAELATSPLLASLLCILFEHDLNLPRNKVELYDRCVHVMLREWDASRGFSRKTKYEKLSDGTKIKLFSRIGAHLFSKFKIFFKKEEVIDAITEFLDLIDIPTDEAPKILKEMESHHGIIVERAVGIFSFSHLTFHEFFAAKFYCQNSKILLSLLDKSLSRWQEVAILSAGLMEDATDFLSTFFKDDLRHLKFISKCIAVEAPISKQFRANFYISVTRMIDQTVSQIKDLICHYEYRKGIIYLATKSRENRELQLLKFACEASCVLLAIDRIDLRKYLAATISKKQKGPNRTIYKTIAKSIQSDKVVKRIKVVSAGEQIYSVSVV